jgi:hypothetical protein
METFWLGEIVNQSSIHNKVQKESANQFFHIWVFYRLREMDEILEKEVKGVEEYVEKHRID